MNYKLIINTVSYYPEANGEVRLAQIEGRPFVSTLNFPKQFPESYPIYTTDLKKNF